MLVSDPINVMYLSLSYKERYERFFFDTTPADKLSRALNFHRPPGLDHVRPSDPALCPESPLLSPLHLTPETMIRADVAIKETAIGLTMNLVMADQVAAQIARVEIRTGSLIVIVAENGVIRIVPGITAV